MEGEKHLQNIYKLTYPNGKIYIGKDLVGDINLFGSYNADSKERDMVSERIQRDFTFEEAKDFTVRKEILWSSDKEVEVKEVIKKENELIKFHNSTDPNIGYN